jgi:hypothetical protein
MTKLINLGSRDVPCELRREQKHQNSGWHLSTEKREKEEEVSNRCTMAF